MDVTAWLVANSSVVSIGWYQRDVVVITAVADGVMGVVAGE